MHEIFSFYKEHATPITEKGTNHTKLQTRHTLENPKI